MNKLKEVLKDRKSIAIGVCVLILLVIIIAVAVVLICGDNINSKSQEEQLKANLEELGREFYEDLYYPNAKNGDEEARSKFLADFKDQGLKFDLDNLSRYEYKTKETQDKLNTFVNEKTKKECDKKESKAVIYPLAPYGKNDYKIEIILVCDFDENK